MITSNSFESGRVFYNLAAYHMAIVLRSLRAVNVAYYGVVGKSAALVIGLFDIAYTLAVEISGI